MSIWKSPISLEKIQLRSKNTMVETLNIEFIEIGDSFLKATMPVDTRVKQPAGIMHGGASCVLAETVGSTAANFAINNQHQLCVGLSIHTSHIRSVREGNVTAMATAIHIGRSTHVWNIDIVNEKEQLISTTRLTMAVLKRKNFE